MRSVDKVLAIAGAAERSYIASKPATDLRYTATFANENSGLSFGVFQFDVATNSAGKNVFRGILTQAISATILTPDGANNLRFFAYLLASYNRYPDNLATFESWLKGEKVTTKNAPAGGFQLKTPPSIEEMHVFFKSLRIWDGTQGNYQYLRDRLDPTLINIGG